MKPSLLRLAMAVGVVLGALVYWLSAGEPPAPAPAPQARASAPTRTLSSSAEAPVPARTVLAVAQTLPVHAAAAQPTIARTREPGGDTTPDLADYVNPGENPTMPQVIDRLHQAGVYSGLGAFAPPGTRPALVGLAVPEDFALPEGYVRHYQATDDGQRIEPILMFAPDTQFVDASGQAVAVPQDRVVPPELAPPGLPIRRITVPAPAEPGPR